MPLRPRATERVPRMLPPGGPPGTCAFGVVTMSSARVTAMRMDVRIWPPSGGIIGRAGFAAPPHRAVSKVMFETERQRESVRIQVRAIGDPLVTSFGLDRPRAV